MSLYVVEVQNEDGSWSEREGCEGRTTTADKAVAIAERESKYRPARVVAYIRGDVTAVFELQSRFGR